MTERQDKWVGYAAVVVVVALAAFVCWFFGIYRTAQPAPADGVRAELAEERIEKIETRAKSERRAARARVDREVQDAAATGDLVDFLDSRARR